MSGPRPLLVAIVCGAAPAVAGCGATTHSSTHRTPQRRPAVHYASQSTQSGRTVGSGTIVLHRLGTLRFRCVSANGIVAELDPRGVLATERAYVEGDGHRHLRAGTIQPGTVFAAPDPASGSELWHVIQDTEPETLDARITITMGPGCTGRWRAQVGVISHAGRWSPPQPWL